MRSSRQLWQGAARKRPEAPAAQKQRPGALLHTLQKRRPAKHEDRGRFLSQRSRTGSTNPFLAKSFDADTRCKLDGYRLLQHLPQAHSEAISAICMTPEKIYTASHDGMLHTWYVVAGSDGGLQLRFGEAFSLGCDCWCLACYGQWLVCGLSDGHIRVFTATGGDSSTPAHNGGVSSLLWHKDVLVSGGANGRVRFWKRDEQHATINKEFEIMEQMPGQVRCLDVHGEALWVGGSAGITIVELATLARFKKAGPKSKVNAFLSYQGHMIAAYGDGTVRVFNALSEVTHTQEPIAGDIMCMVGIEEGPRVLLAHTSGALTSIELPSFAVRCTWKTSDLLFRCLFSAGHNGIALFGSTIGDLQIWQRCDAWVDSSCTAPAQAQGLGASGAPWCSCGWKCTEEDFDAAHGPRNWGCLVCGQRSRTKRWHCNTCAESFCYECFPVYNADERKKNGYKEAITVEGMWVTVRKHSAVGCAILAFVEEEDRNALLARFFRRAPLVLGGIAVELKPHWESQSDGSQAEDQSSIFAGWKQPKKEGECRLSARTLCKHIDKLCHSLRPIVDLDD